MRVGIDYTSAATQGEGIGRSARELVRAMLRLPDCPELHLIYAHRGPLPAADALAVHERVTVRRLPLSPRVMLAGWYKARLPVPIEALLGPLHVMHGPDFVLPPRIAAAGVVTVHDLAFATRPEDAHPAQRRFLESAVPWSIDRARLVIAVSETTRRDLMMRYGVRPHRIRVVPNAVSPEFHERDSADELAAARRRLRLPDEYLLSVGTIHPRKNLGGLARAAALTARQLGRALPVVHVGREGWLCARVFADVESAGPPGIRFIGQTSDAMLRVLYRRQCIDFEGLNNPVDQWRAGGGRPHRPRRRRIAAPAEVLPSWHRGFETAVRNDVARDAFRFGLYTGMRRAEVFGLEWVRIDMGRAVLHVDDTKSGEPLEFPVTRQLAAILERRLAERERFATETRGWVFPSESSASGHLEGMQHLNARIGEAGGAKFWFHALRNCFISVADRDLMLPASLTKRLVNHSRPEDLTEGYAADWTMEQPRNAAQSIADRIDELIRGTRPAEETASQNAFRSFAGSDALS